MRVFMFLLAISIAVIGLKFEASKEAFRIEATVTNVGACGGGEGLFAEPASCMTEVITRRGDVEFWPVRGRAVAGMPVVRDCWRLKGRTEFSCLELATLRKSDRP